MTDRTLSSDERPWPVGTRLRYWARVGDRYTSVEVVGYTKSGRVRVRWSFGGQVTAVTRKFLSVQ